jgi:hypothetical protein
MMLVAITSGMRAQTANAEPQAAPPPANTTLVGRHLKSSVFQTNSSGINTNCGPADCQTAKLLFPSVSVTCPGPVKQTCTLHILLESSNQVSAFDQGLYRFLVDSHVPAPGPTNSSGFFKFVESDPNSDDTHSGSFAVVARITNSAVNQAHKVSIYFGCHDDTGDGCFAFAALSSLRVDVFTP